MQSIQRFLLISLLLASSIVTLAAATWTYYDVADEVDELFDGQLIEAGHILHRLITRTASHSCIFNMQILLGDLEEPVNSTPSDIDDNVPFFFHNYEVHRVFQIWTETGVLVLKSQNAPDYPLANAAQSGFSHTKIGKNEWRVFTLDDEKFKLRFQVAQRQDLRHKLLRKISSGPVIPLLIMFPVLGIFIWLAVGRGLRPIERIANDVNLREFGALDHVPPEKVPKEILPLVEELNSLFDRLDGSLEHEKRFIADAAHELRTPLAALKAQVQVALRTPEPDGHKRALENVIACVNRCSHVVQQLSTLNKIKPDAPINDPEIINLTALAQQCIADLIHMAVEKNIEISLMTEKPVKTVGNDPSIRILLRNIVDNAVRYTPAGGVVQIETLEVNGNPRIVVTDNGPGIPDDLKERVFERFYRRLGSKETGSGLGLSIVSQIVALHKAKILLETPENGQGLRFIVEFVGIK